MSESFFAALRVVAMMLAVDGKVGEKESSWFLALMNSYGVSHVQREILRGDLKGRSDLKPIFASITNPLDRERLMHLARAAMNADGVVDPAESEFFGRLQELNQQAAMPVSEYRELANAMLESDKELRVWNELGEAGRFLSRDRYYGNRFGGGGIFQMLFVIGDLVQGLLLRNRILLGFLIGLLLICVLMFRCGR